MTVTLKLWDDLRDEGVQFLLTNRLENEFSIARQKGGYNRNPSVRNFRMNLRQRIQAALITPPNVVNCMADEDCLLSNELFTPPEQLCPPSFLNMDEKKCNTDEEEDPNKESSSDGGATTSYGEQQQPSLESCSV